MFSLFVVSMLLIYEISAFSHSTSLKSVKKYQEVDHKTLAMSSIDEKKELLGIKKKKRKSWPPPPEDTLVLTGDVCSLMIYCFMDHLLDSSLSEESVLHSLVTSSSTSIQVPSWSDASLHNFGSSLLREILNQQQIAKIGTFANAEHVSPHYTPCLKSAGISFILLTSCWILSGYFNRSFSLQNTIAANPNDALKITLRTWIFTALMVFGVALGTSRLCGCEYLGTVGLSKSDVEFIVDSLTVLATWRFIVATMLNGPF